MVKITLARGEDKRIRAGHQWIFSNEIRDSSGEKMPGEAAEIYDAGGDFVGIGYYNPRSLIAVRLMARTRTDIDAPDFYLERINRSLSLRRQLYPSLDTFRVVHGEGDFLPGLVVDKFGDYLSVQFLTCGMERRKGLIIGILRTIFSPRGIVVRNDSPVRGLEGLEEVVEVACGDPPDLLEIEEHSLRFRVDLLHGQKTGHFLDQKENHLLLKGMAKGKDILDCFCYSGSWGIHAASFGAASVTCIDASERAIALARENAELNGFSGIMKCETGDAFERLRSLEGEGRSFDVVVLDPPAFVKSRKVVKEAMKGYFTINRRAMGLLRPGGYLLTCSCSYHMEREMFRDLLANAARQARREVRLVEVRTQAPDHPILLSMPETEYLKCFVIQTV
ncbi:MAG TPA: class I SAM-dependent rRNA methyltransferase [Geobacteraceae bacterium]|nr:class I SAM-dependent rRNA methyltransferase [Geobacteraceae bacterium]